MKAIVLTEKGGLENLQVEDLDIPVAGADEVLIKTHAISVNPVDFKTRKGGALYSSMKEQPPVILGWDVSGEVVGIGNNVTKFKVGDAVFGMVNFPGHGRAYAEYVVAPASHLSLKPDNTNHEVAAATTLAALTAWQALVHQAGIRKGQHVLVHAAAGGVGHFAVQIAKYFGAIVSGTASSANAAFVKELGADHYVDYTTGDITTQVHPVDIVLDPIGGDTTALSLKVLKPGGTLISIVGGIKDHLKDEIEAKDIDAKNYLVQSSGADIEQLAKLLADGKLYAHISHAYTFDEMAQAHMQLETGRTRGKIVLTM